MAHQRNTSPACSSREKRDSNLVLANWARQSSECIPEPGRSEGGLLVQIIQMDLEIRIHWAKLAGLLVGLLSGCVPNTCRRLWLATD